MNILYLLFSVYMVLNYNNVQSEASDSKMSYSKNVTDNSNKSAITNKTDTTYHKIKDDIYDSGPLMSAFFIFIFISLLAITFFAYRSYKLRFSRAERRYGVQGNRTLQELTPLPLAMEDDDSETENQTLFEIQQSRNATLVA